MHALTCHSDILKQSPLIPKGYESVPLTCYSAYICSEYEYEVFDYRFIYRSNQKPEDNKLVATDGMETTEERLRQARNFFDVGKQKKINIDSNLTKKRKSFKFKALTFDKLHCKTKMTIVSCNTEKNTAWAAMCASVAQFIGKMATVRAEVFF